MVSEQIMLFKDELQKQLNPSHQPITAAHTLAQAQAQR